MPQFLQLWEHHQGGGYYLGLQLRILNLKMAMSFLLRSLVGKPVTLVRNLLEIQYFRPHSRPIGKNLELSKIPR